jgi:2-polyprenyl-3-methyl-5-hydroxy-6-metoxy-1,4-benzoquinol methylase
MKQNKYDDPAFYESYSNMARSLEGLPAAGEWEAFQSLLPDFTGKNVLDLGCGFGWHCRYAREMKAQHVVGVDLSERMLERARTLTKDNAIEYQRGAIEDFNFASGHFDVVISSLAFHYLEDFRPVCQKVHKWLAHGGSFVFSVEHPIFTSQGAQDWHKDSEGGLMHWPVDNYQSEGLRNTKWLTGDVVKYHRTISTYLNCLIDSSFEIARVIEPKPPESMLQANPLFKDELRRPMFLIISAFKK